MDEVFLNELSLVYYNRAIKNNSGKKLKINSKQDNYVARFICSNTFFDCEDDEVLLDKICQYLIDMINKYNTELNDNGFNEEELNFLINKNNSESGFLHWVQFKEKDFNSLTTSATLLFLISLTFSLNVAPITSTLASLTLPLFWMICCNTFFATYPAIPSFITRPAKIT